MTAAKSNFKTVFGQDIREPLAPFDQDHCIAVEDFVEAQRGDLLDRVQTVEVDVIDAGIAVFVDQGKGRTRYFFGLGGSKFADNAFGKSCFSGSQVSDQEDHGARRQIARDAASQLNGFFFGIGGEGGQVQPWGRSPTCQPNGTRLFVAQSFHRVEPRSFAGRPNPEEQADTDANYNPSAAAHTGTAVGR